MALLSPGVQVTVIDESQYISSAVNTVPYFVIATAQNKVSGAGAGVAAGTLAANANKTYLITSQRDLSATFGVPFFYNTTAGTPINGYELNEYGLLAAYSALGVTNRAYVQRVDIDLTELTASLSRPLGIPADGTWWLDTSTSVWGIQEWNASTNSFSIITPTVYSSTADVVDAAGGDFTPLQSLGSIGDYAIVAVDNDEDYHIDGWYKNNSNTWVKLGTTAWQQSWPTVSGTGTPASLTTGSSILINDTVCTVGAGSTASTVAGFATAINNASITGVTAAAVSGKLVIYADDTATNDGSTATEGIVSIEAGSGGTALLAALGISAIEYYTPIYFASFSYNAPRWSSTQSRPRPTGSIWNNISSVNNGISVKLKQFNAALGQWILVDCPAYPGEAAYIAAKDPSGGGKNIPVGTTFIQPNVELWESTPLQSMALEIYERIALGAMIVTGTTVPTGNAFNVGDEFIMQSNQPGSTVTFNTGTVTIGGTGTVADFLAAVSAAGVPYVSASTNSAGNIVFTQSSGGPIQFINVSGTALTTAGITLATPKCRVSAGDGVSILASNFVTSPLFQYTAGPTAPDINPDNGRLWYYSSVEQVDIMIQNFGQWQGYQNVANDVRGYDLTLCNAAGPIVAATAPTSQTDAGASPLQYGDLWVDSSDLENYPKIYRWESVSGTDQWVSIDTSDQVSQNGILFADARWATNGGVDPAAGEISSIESLLTSNYVDLDAPSATLYPQGMLLWNTRRSGYNIKQFTTNYFTAANYPDAPAYNPALPATIGNLPEYSYTWVSVSGLKSNGSMYSGRQAQRQMIVQAMKAGIDTSLGAREETSVYNLIAATGYPELLPNMIALSNERNNTLFVVGDTPMRLPGDGNSLVEWATNNSGLGTATGDGQQATSNYAATFYPSCQTTDLGGNTVVTAPSHMMMRTIIRSDEVSYPWLAPAGTRRGVVDNALQLGYIDSATGEFQPLSVNQALRDILYLNNVNPITFVNGVGITNFGNKTSTTTTTALDRINVARLVAFMRGRLEEIGKLYLFEPNDQITRNEITNTINSLMVDLIAKRAIYDYLVVCDLSNNTPARIDANELWVDVAIEPVKAVEFIYIPLRIKNTGEIAGGV
jgi:hypothetical protein